MNDSCEDVMIPVRCWWSPYGFVFHKDDLRGIEAAYFGRDFVDPFGDVLEYERKRIAAQNGLMEAGSGRKKPRRAGKSQGAQKPEGSLRDSFSKRLEKWQKV